MKKKEKYDNREEQVEDATAEVEAYHSGINASTQVRFFNINFHLDSFGFTFKVEKYRKYKKRVVWVSKCLENC